MQAALRPEALARYAIKGSDADFGALEGQALPNTGVVSIGIRRLPDADAGLVLAHRFDCNLTVTSFTMTIGRAGSMYVAGERGL